MIRRMLFRLLMIIVAPIVLLPATIYAHIKGLNRLPWGLDPVFGCEEDGWNGNGIDPDNPRQFWVTKRYGHYVGDEGKQGWWPDYLRIDWDNTNTFKRWWLSYKWCAFRNVCWNLRLRKWFGVSIHCDEIMITKLERESYDEHIEWINKDGKYWHRKKRLGNYIYHLGWEFHSYTVDKSHPLHERFKYFGYVGEYKYKRYSIPSFGRRRVK